MTIPAVLVPIIFNVIKLKLALCHQQNSRKRRYLNCKDTSYIKLCYDPQDTIFLMGKLIYIH